MQTIPLKEVLDAIDSADPFAIAFVTDDENRGTGGEWIEVKEARKHNFMSKAERKQLDKAQPQQLLKKDPHHYENSTRNIVLPNGEIRKFSIRLVRRFDKPGVTNLFRNGKVVM